MVQIKDIARYLESLAPPSYAESYDNVGLLIGDGNAVVKGVLVSLDCTEEVIEEAIAKGCNVVVSHHPLLFKGLKRLTGANYVERTAIKAIKHDVAVYAIHTNLDSVPDGVNGRIADRIGLVKTRILAPKRNLLMKLVFFVPHDHANTVRNEIFKVGAGVIGNYSGCSFNATGTGTFRPEAGAQPTIGEVETAHEEPETRVEIMFPTYLESAVIRALKTSHPYEEVAYYLHALENENQTVGLGMIGDLSQPMSFDEFLNHLKDTMKLQSIRFTRPKGNQVSRVALCGGSGSFLLPQAKAARADVFVTGDFKYHDFFDAEGELSIIDIGHYESERFTSELLIEKIRGKFSNFATHLTEVNTNPIHYI